MRKLPEEYRKLAIKNADPDCKDLNPDVDLARMFSWKDSPEDQVFWIEVDLWLDEYHDDLPPIPTPEAAEAARGGGE